MSSGHPTPVRHPPRPSPSSRGPSSSLQRPSSPCTADLLSSRPNVTLPYSIAAVSSFSGCYAPDNILVDRPQDLTSRWSGASVAAVATGKHPSSSSSISSPPTATQTPSAANATSVSRLTVSAPFAPTSGKQYVVLKLDELAIVKSIFFGKFYKAHPCNLKDFKVYGGPSSDPSSGLWTRLLRAGLRNDAVPEEFPLRWSDTQGIPMPLRYIKVVPLAAHSPNYNFSVWHIALKGISDRALIGHASHEYNEHCESTTMRLILKHLRARGHHSAFQALLSSSKLDGKASPSGPSSTAARPPSQRPFEHPLVTRLYQAIMRGDWDVAERCLETAAGFGGESCEDAGGTSLFAAAVSKCSQQAEWTRLLGTDVNGDVPSARGGHQLVLDTVKGTAYLFGGWDGKTDLNDLWIYYMEESRWRCISRDTTQQGGPSPRSCHRMAFDSRSGIIYVLGRYVDYDKQQQHRSSKPADAPSRGATASPSAAGSSSARATPLELPPSLGTPSRTTRDAPSIGGSEAASVRAVTLSPNPAAAASSREQGGRLPSSPRTHESHTAPYSSDFFRFSTRNERWNRLSADTALDGGPKLIFDHQMVVDEESQVMYVFGGRVVHWDPAQLQLSGMWSYDCIQRTWTFLFDDDTRTGGKILSRAGHSMLLDVGAKGGGSDGKRQLWILAGQRADAYLADMYTYSLSTGQVRQISRDYSQGGRGPEGGFTQRATLDIAKREIHLFNGIVRRTKQTESAAQSALWVYNIDRDEWKQVWKGGSDHVSAIEEDDGEEESSNMDGSYVDKTEGEVSMMDAAVTAPVKKTKCREPQPRYASQMVFDAKSESFLLFGGNPADPQANQGRLDDLWSLRLLRPQVGEVLRRAKFALRQQRFKEMAAAVVPRPGLFSSSLLAPPSANGADGGLRAMEALAYLQTEVAAVVDHDVPGEARTFRRLVAGLLGGRGLCNSEEDEEEIENGDEGNDEGDEGPTLESGNKDKDDDKDDDKDSDGLPAVDDDADMLSVSQTLPRTVSPITSSCLDLGVGRISHSTKANRGGGGEEGGATSCISSMPTALSAGTGLGVGLTLDYSVGPALDSSQRPAPLFRQRRTLFRLLLDLLPPHQVEPPEDLATCVAAYTAALGSRRAGLHDSPGEPSGVGM